jgi:hypothetical protein
MSAPTEDEWFADHPHLGREWWMSIDHSNCAVYPDGLDYDFDAPMYQQCRSVHCPQCGQRTGSQGHIRDGKCPVVAAASAQQPSSESPALGGWPQTGWLS